MFTPVEYLSLAKGDSRMYMVSELVYDVFIAIAVPLAYGRYGLWGAGAALSVGGCVDLLFVYIAYRYRYGYTFSFRLLPVYAVQFVLLAVAVGVSFYLADWIYWLIGVVLLAVTFERNNY